MRLIRQLGSCRRLVALLLFIASFSIGVNRAGGQIARDGQLTVIGSPTVEGGNGRGTARVESAEIMDRTTVERDFEVLNASDDPVTIRSLRASCGCERATLFVDGSPVPSASLLPGQSASVHVTVRLTGGDWKSKSVQVTVLGKDETSPLAVLVIDIRQDWFWLSKGVLVFNASLSGDLELTMAAGLPELIANAPLVSRSKWIRVRELEQPADASEKKVRRFTVSCDVALSPGRHHGALEFDVPLSAKGPAAEALRRIKVIAVREVANDLEVAPSVISINLVTVPAQYQVVLSSLSPDSLASVRVEGLSPGCRVTFGKLMTMGGAKPRFMRIVTIFTTPSARIDPEMKLAFRNDLGSQATVRMTSLLSTQRLASLGQ